MVPMGVHRSVMVAQMRVWVCKTSCNEDPLISGLEIKSKVQLKKNIDYWEQCSPAMPKVWTVWCCFHHVWGFNASLYAGFMTDCDTRIPKALN